MPDLKLAKLPDRTPVKLTITVMPDLAAAVNAYAGLSAQSYCLASLILLAISDSLSACIGGGRR